MPERFKIMTEALGKPFKAAALEISEIHLSPGDLVVGKLFPLAWGEASGTEITENKDLLIGIQPRPSRQGKSLKEGETYPVFRAHQAEAKIPRPLAAFPVNKPCPPGGFLGVQGAVQPPVMGQGDSFFMIRGTHTKRTPDIVLFISLLFYPIYVYNSRDICL
jgi:hypothetical protein